MRRKNSFPIIILIILISLLATACVSLQTTNTTPTNISKPILEITLGQTRICDISFEQDGSRIRFDGEIGHIDETDPDIIEIQLIDPLDDDCTVWIWVSNTTFNSWNIHDQQSISIGNIIEITGIVYNEMGEIVVHLTDSESQVEVLKTNVPIGTLPPPTVSPDLNELQIPQALLPWTENYDLVIEGRDDGYYAKTKEGKELGYIQWGDVDTPWLYAENVEVVQGWLKDLGDSSFFNVTEKPEMALSTEDLYTSLTVSTEKLIILDDIIVVLPGDILARPVGIWHSFTYDPNGNILSADLDFILVGSYEFMHIEQLLVTRPRISLFLGCSQAQFNNYLELKENSSDFWVPPILYHYRWLIDHYEQENLIVISKGTVSAWSDFVLHNTFDPEVIQNLVYIYLN